MGEWKSLFQASDFIRGLPRGIHPFACHARSGLAPCRSSASHHVGAASLRMAIKQSVRPPHSGRAPARPRATSSVKYRRVDSVDDVGKQAYSDQRRDATGTARLLDDAIPGRPRPSRRFLANLHRALPPRSMLCARRMQITPDQALPQTEQSRFPLVEKTRRCSR